MTMTSEEIQKAEAIVREWFWQPDSWHRKSVVRYYESAPIQPDVLQLVITYLKQQETDRLFILNKELQLGETWKATDAWFQTSPSDKWAGTESTKIRIYQAFKPKADESDGPYTVENGCKYLVTHEFHWDVAEVPTLPASSSGVNYTLQGVTRDKETGLYSCVIEKRETVQQDVALYDTAKTIFETVQDEQHLGVKQNDVASTGQQASAANGVLVKRQLRKNPDCTTDVVNETTIEEPVSGATVEYRKTLRGSTQTVVDRNQQNPVSGSGLAVGEIRRSEKTPGGLYNNSTTTKGTDPVGKIAQSCQIQSAEHTDTRVDNQLDEPSEIEQTAEVNKLKIKIVRRTDDDNYDVEERTTTFAPQNSGAKTWTDGDGTTYEALNYRNQAQPILPTGGSASSANFQLNAHGSYDGGYLKRTFSGSSGSGGAAFHHSLNLSKYQVTKVAGGKTKVRPWTVNVDVYGGEFQAVLQNVLGPSETPPKDFPWIGCYSHVEGGGKNAIGYKYNWARAGREHTLADNETL